MANDNLESSYLVLKTQVTKMEKELDRLRKLTQELTSEISHFMFLDNGVNLDSYGGEVPKAPGFPMVKERTVYLMDEWFMDPSDKGDA
ncbi:hypothetical protein F2Q69_00045584 [Brassica cretica]|uniref:Uncharacterized protein n=1 Tax=Brassica cretica TaxID=69181 RepID=A0A8S9NLA0_BRACR|nr:hypothetical protein F2Q69_00045584 [Brassica cretica]